MLNKVIKPFGKIKFKKIVKFTKLFGNPTSKHPLNYLSTPLTALTTLSNKPVFNYSLSI